MTHKVESGNLCFIRAVQIECETTEENYKFYSVVLVQDQGFIFGSASRTVLRKYKSGSSKSEMQIARAISRYLELSPAEIVRA